MGLSFLETDWEEIQEILVKVAPLLEGREKLARAVEGDPSISAKFDDVDSDGTKRILLLTVAYLIEKDELALFQYDLFYDAGFRNIRLQEFSWGRMRFDEGNGIEGFWLGSTSDETTSVYDPRGEIFSGDLASRVPKSQAVSDLLNSLRMIETKLIPSPEGALEQDDLSLS